MLKRYGSALVACALVLCSLTDARHVRAAKAAAHASAGTITLTMLTHWTATTLQTFKPYVKEYQTLHPNVRIQITTVPFDQPALR